MNQRHPNHPPRITWKYMADGRKRFWVTDGVEITRHGYDLEANAVSAWNQGLVIPSLYQSATSTIL